MSRLEPPVGEWRRVSPKYIAVDLVGTFAASLFSTAGASLPALITGISQLWILPLPVALISLVNLILIPRRVRAIGYQLREDDLLFRRGRLVQRVVAVPYGRMQLVDINRGPVARALGLSELKFVTAAAATGVVLPGLPEREAEELRDTLVALAETRRAGL
ncbi:MAG: PH domain-containing protein [Salinibacterium sp.]|nr:MAG: PH domain-containing protein [Salinibacterium sp.]